MDRSAIDHHYTNAGPYVNGSNRDRWIVALTPEGVFSPVFVAAIQAIGWRWVTIREAREQLTGLQSRRLALLAVDRFSTDTYGVIRFIAGTLDLPVIVFSLAASLSDVCKSLRAGAEDIISIAYAPEEGVARLNSVLNGRYRITAGTSCHAHVMCRCPDVDRSRGSRTGGEKR